MTDSSTKAIAILRSPDRGVWVWPAVTVALGVAVLALNGPIRNAEAVVTAHFLGWLTGKGTWVVYPHHILYWHTNRMVTGVEVTAECSSALLIGLLLVVGAGIFYSGRFSNRRVGVALVLTCPLLFLLNLGRLAAIAWASSQWSYQGYDWAHTVGGTLLTIAAATISVGLFILILLHQGRQDRNEVT